MATELIMPQMGYDMQEGTILRWLKGEGEDVKNGDPIAEIETDKAVVEFESYAEGVLNRILVSEGTTVPVGKPIAIIGAQEEAGAAAAEAPSEAEDTSSEMDLDLGADVPLSEQPAEAESAAIPMPAAGEPMPDAMPPESAPEAALAEHQAPATPLRASPVARRIAEERGINIAEVVGTGPGGRIVREDVQAYAEALAAEPPAAEETQTDAEADAAVPADEPMAEVVSSVDAEEGAADADEEQVDDVVDEMDTEAVEEMPVAEPVVDEPTDAVAVESDAVDVEMAADLHVDAVEEADVVDEPMGDTDAGAVEDGIKLSRMRQQIARVTLRSKQEKPHFYVTSEVDMTEAMSLRQQINSTLADEGVRVTVNDLIIKACVDALKKYPKFNAFLDGDTIRLNDRVNVGIAMAVEGGLLMPAIMGCEDMSLKAIAVASKDLADRSQNGTLRPDEYTGGTFGISNLGMFDVSTFVAIIQPPQSAIIAVGTVAKKPVVRGDDIVIRQVMNATISADHRVVDGAEGAQFLIEVKRLLENPLSLIL